MRIRRVLAFALLVSLAIASSPSSAHTGAALPPLIPVLGSVEGEVEEPALPARSIIKGESGGGASAPEERSVGAATLPLPSRRAMVELRPADVHLSATATDFDDINAALTSVCRGSVAWGDYDNDGDLDILLTGWNNGWNYTKIYRNDGGGSFTDINASLPYVHDSSVAWGDYDNDGDLDILLTGWSSIGRIARVYRNDGSGILTDINAALTGVEYSSAAWGDYDNDGDLDILLTGGSSLGRIAKVYENGGDGVFTDIGAVLTGVYQGSVAWGDYDNDGDLDILLTGWTGSSSIAKVYRNDGSGTFADVNAVLTGVDDASAAWGDYDNDGDLDILLTGGTGSDPIAKVYRNDGSGAFTDINAVLTRVYGSSVAWGDYDNDGDLDILLTGSTNSSTHIAKVYRNDGSGTFTDINAVLTGVGWYSSVAWGDYDNDGDLDILLTGCEAGNCDYGTAKVYRNNITTANTVPAAPSGLVASQTGTTATLSWSASSDAQTPASGLTYNLRVGTTSGGSQIASPMANTGTGYRRVPQLGNANHGLTAVLKNLTPGTYYWSVQANDTAFAGSSFANEGSFTVVIPPGQVLLSGPTTGLVDTAYTFTAIVNPISATTPITYVWQATGQALVTHTDNLDHTDTMAFTWSTPGTQVITVRAGNDGGTVTETHTVAISASVIYLPLTSKRWPPIPNTPVLNPIDNTDQDNYYTVTWQEADLATTYILEEATNASFSGAQTVYQGASLSWTVPDPGKTLGTYYYRVKGRNSWGDSSWSNVQSAVVTWADLIVNGGFESGPPAPPWVQSSTVGEMIHRLGARTGNWGVYMGGAVNAVDQIYQQVTIPSTVSSPQLSYWRLIRTSDSISTVYDEMRCVIWDTSGNVLAFCGEFSNVDQSQDWIRKTYNMSAFRGRTVHIGFKAFNDGVYSTQFFIDDVSLSVTSSTATQANQAEFVLPNSLWRLTGLLQAPQQGEASRLPSRLELTPR